VRKALHLGIDRQQVVDVIGSGEWKLQGPVGSAVSYWALPEEELLAVPGYRSTTAEREEDIAEARALYEAAGSPEIPRIWFADVPGYIPNFQGTYIETMRNNIGADLKASTNSYAIIAEGLLRECGDAPMTWGFDNGWIDLDDWVFPYFRTGGSKNSFEVSDPDLDNLLDAQRREFDIDRRRELGFQIQRYLLGLDGNEEKPSAFARLDYAAPFGAIVSWPYFKNRVSFPWFGNNYWTANIWMDRDDPSFQNRPPD
jgi:peptide/nickel transport system substrate-binding protein